MVGAVALIMAGAGAFVAAWVGAKKGLAPGWWRFLGLPEGEEEENGNGSNGENGDDADPEGSDNGLHGGRPGDPGGNGGGQVPFDHGLVLIGAAELTQEAREQEANAAAIRSDRK